MKHPVVAIADDDLSFANYLKTFLASRGYDSRIYGHGEELLAAARHGDVPDVVLLDVMMPGMDGLATLKNLKAAHPIIQVIMLSGRENAPTIVEAINLGAVNYVVKPDDPQGLGEIALEAAIKQAVENTKLVSEVTELRRQVNDDQTAAFFFWEKSETMRNITRMIERVADSDVTVLLRGESGVGKELVARAIHERSVRRTKPFVKVNCAALPDDLLESELFGHEKGAFTGAATTRVGKFEYADSGTLMLDEIGEMKAGLQGKLLHVLQDNEFTKLGSNKRVNVDVRIIAATNRDLEGMMKRSEFREDLYYRLRVIEIVVPPLRERKDEIQRLAEFFIGKYSTKYNRAHSGLSPALRDALQGYGWPGNIRELENVMKRFAILQDEPALIAELRTTSARHQESAAAAPVAAPVVPEKAPEPVAASNGNGHAPSAPAGPQSLADAARQAVLKAERDLIIPTLRKVQWNRRKAAPLLGISYKTLLNKIKEYGIVQE
jgi:two-component system, NtrC family, response regulator AtoC